MNYITMNKFCSVIQKSSIEELHWIEEQIDKRKMEIINQVGDI